MGDTDAREGAVAPALPAARIGRYELRDALGQGSTGRVYLAWDPFGLSEVALKVFDARSGPRAPTDDELARQFMSEASLVGKLSHAHIASILEASAGADPAYIAMEYVSGGTLKQYAAADRLLPTDRLMQIAFKTCGALDYASKKGIVHRDLKRANLLLSGDTHVKVADFGAARLKQAQGAQPSNLGSPAYMAPERIADREPGPQSDMFPWAFHSTSCSPARGRSSVPICPRSWSRSCAGIPGRQAPFVRASRAGSTTWCCACWRRAPPSVTRPGLISRSRSRKSDALA